MLSALGASHRALGPSLAAGIPGPVARFMGSYYTDAHDAPEAAFSATTRNGVTLTRPIPLWLLRIAWVTLPLTAGPAASAALRDWSDGPRVVAEVLLWLAWAAGLLATIAPRPVALTALRTIAPAFFVLAVVAALSGEPSTPAMVSALVATAIAAVLASGHDIAIAAVNAIAYGDEQRVPLRVPPALFLAPLPLARSSSPAVVVGPLLLADGRIVLGLVALAIGVPLVAVLGRALHGLSRRWAVLVPAGFVVVDPMTLADPVLFLRERITSMKAVDATRPGMEDVLDLRLGATLGSVSLSFDEAAELFRAGRGRRPTETVKTTHLLIAVVRRDEVLRTPRRGGSACSRATPRCRRRRGCRRRRARRPDRAPRAAGVPRSERCFRRDTRARARHARAPVRGACRLRERRRRT